MFLIENFHFLLFLSFINDECVEITYIDRLSSFKNPILIYSLTLSYKKTDISLSHFCIIESKRLEIPKDVC